MFPHGWRTYHCPELDKLKRTCQALRREDERFYEWTGERKQEVTAIKEVRTPHARRRPRRRHLTDSRQHAALCRKWDTQRATERLQELQAIRSQRLEA